MFKALITFSNSETLELSDEQLIIPIVRYESDSGISVSKSKPFEIWYHVHDGLIPSIAELLCNCEFFQLVDDDNKIYSSKSVVSIENL